MRINFATVLTMLDGKPIKENEMPMAKDLSLGIACVNVLLASYPDEQSLDGAEKAKRFRLAMTLNNAQEADLAAEDVALLKKLIGKAYGPLVVGRAYDLLDPETKH